MSSITKEKYSCQTRLELRFEYEFLLLYDNIGPLLDYQMPLQDFLRTLFAESAAFWVWTFQIERNRGVTICSKDIQLAIRSESANPSGCDRNGTR